MADSTELDSYVMLSSLDPVRAVGLLTGDKSIVALFRRLRRNKIRLGGF